MLEEQDPERIPPASASGPLVLAATARLLEGEFKALNGVIADVESSLALVDDLDRLGFSAFAVDVDLGGLHVCFFEEVHLGFLDAVASDVAEGGLAMQTSLLHLGIRILIILTIILILASKDQIGIMIETTTPC